MTRCLPAALAAVALLAATNTIQAQTSQARKPLGVWTHRTDDYKVKIDIKPEMLRCTITGGDGYAIVVDADYVISKDGIVCGIVRSASGSKSKDQKADEELDKRLFYFRCSVVDNKRLIVSDMSYGGESKDKIKEVLEGKYHKLESKETAHARAGWQGQVSQGDLPPASWAQPAPPSGPLVPR